MFIQLGEVRKRINNMKNKYLKNSNININLLKEQSLRDVFSFEKLIVNWQELHSNNYTAFTKLIEQLEIYKNISKSKSDYKKAVLIISERVIPKIKDIKRARMIITKNSHLDIDNILLNECDIFIGCDRLLNNQNKLNKIYDIENVVKENKVCDDESILDTVYELCDIISEINTDIEIKYNLALENVMYSLEKSYVQFSRSMVIENVTDYFLTKFPSSLDSIREVIKESEFYNEQDKINLDFVINEDGLDIDFSIKETIYESSVKTNEVKNILNKLKLIPNKTPSIIKSAINKIYTKSASNIIDETPNFLSWMRNVIIFSSLGVNLYLGCVVLFVDKFIQMSLQRKETDRFITKVKNEKNKAEKKLDKTNSEETKKKLQEYIKTLDNNINKLEVYRDSLYTEKELDNMNENGITLESFLGENGISVDEFINVHQYKVSQILKETCNKYNKVVDSIYKSLKNDILLVSENHNLCIDNKNDIENYIDCDNRLLLPIANIVTNESSNIDNTINSIIDILEDNISKDYRVSCNISEDGLSTLYLSYKERVDVVQESCIHSDIKDDMNLILGLEEQVQNIKDIDMISILKESIHLYEDDLESLTSVILSENLLEKDEYLDILESYRDEVLKENINSKYRVASSINESIYNIKKHTDRSINRNRFEKYNDTMILIEALSAIENINEASGKTNILIARDKLKQSALKLSDKEKVMSKQLDNALSKFNEKIQMELSNKNREQVIKGSILPSASTIMKIGITSGIAAFVNPVFAVITAIGGIAASKAGTKKEKQFILDEIDIQLKLVEKKIQLAENNNDMKALEQLLKIEQKLKRERQRIMYNLKHYYTVNANRD